MSWRSWWRGEPDPLGALVIQLVALEYARHNTPPPRADTLVSDILAQLKEWETR